VILGVGLEGRVVRGGVVGVRVVRVGSSALLNEALSPAISEAQKLLGFFDFGYFEIHRLVG
jgi:hypothetical protein